jgi:NADH dehydrogenase
VAVDATLRPEGADDIFVIGDTAACPDADGRLLPGVAPVAKQQGEHVARAILGRLRGKPARAFRYRQYGSLATIGRSHAVADFGRWRLHGFPAWLLWSTVHVYFLVGFRNRLLVGLALAWNYITFARHARLITGEVSPVAALSISNCQSTGAHNVRVA